MFGPAVPKLNKGYTTDRDDREPDYYDLHHGTGSAEQQARKDRFAYLAARQAGHVKEEPAEAAFCALPQPVVRSVGLSTHMGARIDLALLSALVYWYSRNLESSSYDATTGDEIELEPGAFCLSIQSVAEDLYERWFGERFEEPRLNASFNRFYELVRVGMARLVSKGHVQRLRYAVEDNQTLGIVWTLDGTPLEAYGKGKVDVLKAHPVMGHGLTGLDREAPLVNAVDLIGEAFRNQHADVYRCRFTEVVCEPADSLRTSHTLEHEDVAWAQAVAGGVSGERHMRIGSFARGKVGQDGAKVLLPWVVLEIDGKDFEESLTYAKRFVNRLWEQGVQGMTVAHSGNRSAHVRIPCGSFANAVFRDWRAAKRVLTGWAQRLCAEADVPESAVDFGALDPRHLIRLPGSTRLLKETRTRTITRKRGTPIMEPHVSVFPDATTPFGAKNRPILEVLSKIKEGAYRNGVMSYRMGNEKAKLKLPLVTFSGTFAHRKISGLGAHSGLLVLDYDDLPDVRAFKAAVEKIPHTLAAFTSPSGKGVKVLVPVRVTYGKQEVMPLGEDHKELFEKVRDAYARALPGWARFLDTSGSDVSRGCFVSYDPAMVVNHGAKSVGVAMGERTVTEDVVVGWSRCTVLSDREAMQCECEGEWEEKVRPFTYDDPRKAPVAEEVVLALHAAADRAYGWVQRSMKELWAKLEEGGVEGGTRHAETVARIEKGVEESETWGEPDQKGRTMAAFFLACHYVRQERDEDRVTARMAEVNERFTPPLAPGVLRSQIRGAMNANER